MPAGVQRLPPRNRAQSSIANVDLELAQQHVLRIKMVKQLLEPIKEQEFPIVLGQLDSQLLPRSHRIDIFNDHRKQGPAGLDEERIEVRSTDPKSKVSRMIECLVHTVLWYRTWPSGSRAQTP